MYLGSLNEKQKVNFWVLAKKLAHIDGEVSNEELRYFELYAWELGASKEILDSVAATAEEAIEFFGKADSMTKKKVYIELLALALCNDEFHETEVEFMNDMKVTLGIDNETDAFLKTAITQLMETYDKFERIVNG